MWYIQDLKTRARAVLSQNYWMAFVACLVIAGISMTVNGVMQLLIYFLSVPAAVMEFVDGSSGAVSALYLIASFFAIIVILIVQLLVFSPLQVGVCKYFLRLRFQKSDISSLFSGFSKGYGKLVKTLFFRDLYILLWSLLLVIPGIYKSYEYVMIPYLLAENPNLSKERAFELSSLMMKGEKLHLFGLQCSFIGWYLLTMLTCGFGVLFLTPYINAAVTEAYAALRDKLFYYGYSNAEELPGMPL